MIITKNRIYPVAMMALSSFLILVMGMLVVMTIFSDDSEVLPEDRAIDFALRVFIGLCYLFIIYALSQMGFCYIEKQNGGVLMRGPGRKTREFYAAPAYATMVWTLGESYGTAVNIIPYRALAIVAPEGYELDDLGGLLSPKRRYFEPRSPHYSDCDYTVSRLNWYIMFGWTPWGKRKMQRVVDTVNKWLGHDPVAISEFEAARQAAEDA